MKTAGYYNPKLDPLQPSFKMYNIQRVLHVDLQRRPLACFEAGNSWKLLQQILQEAEKSTSPMFANVKAKLQSTIFRIDTRKPCKIFCQDIQETASHTSGGLLSIGTTCNLPWPAEFSAK